jgi:hypothetical protein
VHVVDLDELLHSLVDNAAEAALDGHMHHCRLDVVLGNPLKTLSSQERRSTQWIEPCVTVTSFDAARHVVYLLPV